MNPVANEVDAVRAELAASRRAWEEADENLWAAANRMTFERSVPAEKVTELYNLAYAAYQRWQQAANRIEELYQAGKL